MERRTENDHSPRQSSHKKKKVLAAVRSRLGNGSGEGEWVAKDSDEEVSLAPNIRKVFIRLQEQRFLTPGGGASAINEPASQLKDGTTLEKNCTT